MALQEKVGGSEYTDESNGSAHPAFGRAEDEPFASSSISLPSSCQETAKPYLKVRYHMTAEVSRSL
jgi:hypothetical protein